MCAIFMQCVANHVCMTAYTLRIALDMSYIHNLITAIRTRKTIRPAQFIPYAGLNRAGLFSFLKCIAMTTVDTSKQNVSITPGVSHRSVSSYLAFGLKMRNTNNQVSARRTRKAEGRASVHLTRGVCRHAPFFVSCWAAKSMTTVDTLRQKCSIGFVEHPFQATHFAAAKPMHDNNLSRSDRRVELQGQPTFTFRGV